MKKIKNHYAATRKTEKSEKRIFNRKQLICYMEVREQETDKRIGNLVDITQEGMMVMSDQPLGAHKIFNLKIPLKKKPGAHDYLNLQAKSTWCKKEMHANFYDTGFEFVNISQDCCREIDFILETLCY